jgi:hypothetical protein
MQRARAEQDANLPLQPAAEPEPVEGSWPLYVAALIVALCGIGAVGATLDESGWSQRCVTLLLLGFSTSYYLRWRRVQPGTVMLVVGAVLIVALILGPGAARLPFGVGQPVDQLMPDLTLAVLIAWLMVLGSFALLTNAAILFITVPSLAVLGLTASQNPNVEIPVFFGIFIFATIFLVVYEQHLRRVRMTQTAPWPIGWHVATASVIFLFALAAGSVFGLLGQRTVGQLSPTLMPALGRIQPPSRNYVGGLQSANQPIRVGAGTIQLTPTPVFDIYAPESGLWRTGVLEEYDGHSWLPGSQRGFLPLESTRQEPPSPASQVPPGVVLPRSLYRFRMEPASYGLPVATRLVRQFIVAKKQLAPSLPTLDYPVEIRYPDPRLMWHRTWGVVRGSSFFSPGYAYEVVSAVPQFPPPGLQQAPSASTEDIVQYGLERCLNYPATAERLPALALRVTAGKTNDFDRVQAIIQYIESTCTYSLNEEPTPDGDDAVEFYLFETRVGACDLAASAAVMLCRAANIPARAVVGYVVDQPLPEGGGFGVREMDAHMWLEVFFPGHGWVTFNPAPPSRELQTASLGSIFHRIGRFFETAFSGTIDTYLVAATALFVFLSLGGPLLLWLTRAVRGWRAEQALLASGSAAALGIIYRRMDRAMARAGWRRDPAMTPLEYQEWLAREWGARTPAAEILARITRRVVQAIYGGHLPAGAVLEARRDLEALRRAAPRRPGRK